MKLIIGKIDEKLTDLIKSEYPRAVLLTEKNYNLDVDVGYTGIEEFKDKECFLTLLLKATTIYYYPIDELNFDFENPTGSGQGLIEYYLFLARQDGIDINQFAPLGVTKASSESDEMLKLVDIRKSITGPQLWAAGCSFTFGAGVDDNQRYANILSKQLNLPLNLLARVGTSIGWAADQILRSNIQSGDIVIWGLTTRYRFTYIKDSSVTPFSVQSPKNTPIEKSLSILICDEKFLTYEQLTHIHQVINFVEKIGAKLLVVGLCTSPFDLIYLNKIKYYYHCHNKNNRYLDIGTDNIHPGPIQHKLYADIVINQIKKRGWM